MNESTKTKNTKWLDDIYEKSFDCSMYPHSKVTRKIIKYKIL